MRRIWIPIVILIVLTAGGATVLRLHRVFGNEKRVTYADTRIDDAKPYNPKHITYEVFGPPGTVAEISYFDGNGDPQHAKAVPLPWTLDFPITQTTSAGSVIAQGNTDSIGCRILVDGVVKAEKTTHEVEAFTFCQLKSA
ncbi:MmpS family protein [Mycobacterium vicinigordonae]|uniref:MmpS family protein n=1 Tax=Mycobacterium vicinigordonae TaxID=1719132 RepID=A0A7D6HUL2_9MYCO|nr:MmpS family protein [Mycobacterium vicinigordonae]QLL07792.1 MmpS family protein [Mycobacterium vicinigordonae]